MTRGAYQGGGEDEGGGGLRGSICLAVLPVCPGGGVLAGTVECLCLLASICRDELLVELFMSIPVVPAMRLVLLYSFIIARMRDAVLGFLGGAVGLATRTFVSVAGECRFNVAGATLVSRGTLLLGDLLLPVWLKGELRDMFIGYLV